MYLDNSATTKVSDEVLEEMLPYLKDEFGNPSTLYSIGRESKKALEEARQRVANAINAKNGTYQGLNNSHIVVFDIHSEYHTAFPKANFIDISNMVLCYN